MEESRLDWAGIWNRAVERHSESVPFSYTRKENAERYSGSALIRKDGLKRAAALRVEPDWTVLDIGSGPGTLEGTSFLREYPNLESAIADLRLRLVLETRQHDEALATYIRENYRFSSEKIVWDDDTRYVRISWKARR